MRDGAVTLPPAFSLLDSAFNEFLFAPIGEESNNTILTVLSALARLGTDPWQELARLAQLPREAAAQSLKAIIAKIPNGNWAPSDSGAIAARLVTLLPAKRALPSLASLPRTAAPGKFAAPARIMLIVFCMLVGGLIFFAIAYRVRAAVPADAVHPPAAYAAPVSPSPPINDFQEARRAP